MKKQSQRAVIRLGVGTGAFLTLSFLLSLWSSPAWAIPAFARKYDLPCSVCHVPSFPKLNDFGNTFRDHGYQLGEENDLPTFEALTKGYWPVAFRTTVGYQYATLHHAGDGATAGLSRELNTGSFGFTGLDILSFGTLARNVSFGIVYTPGLGSAGFNSGSTAGDGDLESAFVKLDSIFHSNYLLNMKAGKYELDLPASEKRSPTLNTPYVMYHYVAGTPYTTVLGNPGLLANQTYSNPNDFALGENQSGLEVAGIAQTPGEGDFRYSLNALSNSTLNTGGSGGGRGLNFYGRVSQSLGGYGVVSGQRVGVFGAYGTVAVNPSAACQPPNPPCPGTGSGNDSFYRIGADASLTIARQVNLIAAFMHADDDKQLFLSQGVANARDAVWDGGFIELDYNPVQWPAWLLIYRYDLIVNEQQADPTFAKSFNDVTSHTLMARYNFNITNRVDTTFHLEYNYFTTKGTSPTNTNQMGQTVLAALDFAL
ncbi:MAG TPA: hypothetical protein VML36_00815 [Nitrospiria bacterium]|nr:hypothetical protein [Nitrospiria bacterium]